jgi:hypothetical protein
MKPQVEFSINIPDKLLYLIHFKTSMHLLRTSSIDAKSSKLRIPILKYYELSSQSVYALISILSSSLNPGTPTKSLASSVHRNPGRIFIGRSDPDEGVAGPNCVIPWKHHSPSHPIDT